MQHFTAFDGQTYRVSDQFGPIDYADSMDTAARMAVEARRRTLDNIVRFLAGRAVADALGAEATLDQVHGNVWEPDTCGCRVAVLFDHYGDPATREHKPHRTHRHCTHHEHCTNPHEHHAELVAENRHKNQAVSAVAAAAGIAVAEVEWSHNAQRELVVKHAKIRPQHVAALSPLGRKTIIG
jgi:hypothetical protein